METSQDSTVALARRYIERITGAGEMSLADTLLDENMVYYTGLAPSGLIRGRETIKQALQGLHTAFDDLNLIIEDAFAADDSERAVIRFRATGTYHAAFLGVPANGKKITMIETHVIRVRAGKVVEDYASDNNYDFALLFAPALRYTNKQ